MTPLNELVDWPNAAAQARNRNKDKNTDARLSKESPLFQFKEWFVYGTIGRGTGRKVADGGRSNTGSG